MGTHFKIAENETAGNRAPNPNRMQAMFDEGSFPVSKRFIFLQLSGLGVARLHTLSTRVLACAPVKGTALQFRG